MNLQEAFEKSVSGIIAQGKPSMNPNTIQCFYRSEDGCKCGIGFLITDEQIKKYDLKNSASVRSENFPFDLLQEILPSYKGDLRRALDDLQAIHDDAATIINIDFLSSFKKNALKYAKKYNLSIPDCLK